MSTLDGIGLRNKTDKSSLVHGFLRIYEVFLEPRRSAITDVLEIGVYDGGSLRTWSEYLPGARITGVDIDPRCLAFAGGNAQVELCDQSDPLALQRLMVKLGHRHAGFDVILDDGSHVWSHQILTFETLWAFLKPGGIFIIEDSDTSYGDHVPYYGRDSTVRAADYIFKLANYVLAGGQLRLTEEPDLRVRAIVPEIDYVVVLHRSVVFFKK